MAKTLHFFLRSFSPYLLIYLAFGCLAVGGSWLSGTPNGLFGSYASMMPMIGVMLGAGLAASGDVYLNVAVSMGARRHWCFWSIEAAMALYSLCAPLFTILTDRALMALFGGYELEGLNRLLAAQGPKSWALLYLLAMALAQAGLLASRVKHPTWRGVLIVVIMLAASAASVVMILFADTDFLQEAQLSAQWPARIAAVLAAAAVALAIPVYQIYRKAVVRE